MAKIQQVKEELLQESEAFVSFLKNMSGSEVGDISTLLGMNRGVFQKVQEVLAEGDETDKKEAMIAFAKVMQSFGDVSKQMAGIFGIESEASPKLKT